MATKPLNDAALGEILAEVAADNAGREPNPTLDLIDPKLDAELKTYHAAFEEEFSRTNAKTAISHKTVKDTLVAAGPNVARKLVELALESKSDTVRFQASRHIQEYIEKINGGTEGDPFNNLLQRLMPEVKDELEANLAHTNEESDDEF